MTLAQMQLGGRAADQPGIWSDHGLDHLEALAGQPGLARQHYWHAARGHTLARLGRHTAAAKAYRRASELAQTPAEIAYLTSRAEKYTTPG